MCVCVCEKERERERARERERYQEREREHARVELWLTHLHSLHTHQQHLHIHIHNTKNWKKTEELGIRDLCEHIQHKKPASLGQCVMCSPRPHMLNKRHVPTKSAKVSLSFSC